MKKIVVLASVFQLIFFSLLAQNSNIPPVDKSPMDMAYYPVNYPVLKIQDKLTEPLAARVIYSRPQKAGRTIFGSLVKYGEVWRLGANEATEIEFFKSVKIGGKKINKGRYTLYALVNENTWTIIVNKETDTWGSFKYDKAKDVVRKEVTVEKTDMSIESLSMLFEKATGGYNLIVAWDNVKVALPIIF
ncbi:MAG: DUF2911 domain-containing protein [Chitinophagaceae bacterium]|nr:DUF2911 domain-containing protein [Chitinophagaceae bacterium]MBP9103736.1 DUF2911 domain-containing protein [Chitinophagaceae bacterium]